MPGFADYLQSITGAEQAQPHYADASGFASYLQGLGSVPPTAQDPYQIPEDVAREARRQRRMALLASLGQAQPGYLGSALAQGAFQGHDVEQQYLQRYGQEQAARQEKARLAREQEMRMGMAIEQARQQAAQQALAEQQRREQEMAVNAVAEQVMGYAQGPDDPLAAQVQAAAAAGDMGTLQKLADQAEQRAYIQKMGIDPNNPLAMELAAKEQGVGRYFAQPGAGGARTAAPQVIHGQDDVYIVDPNTGRKTPLGIGRGGTEGTENPLMDKAIEIANRRYAAAMRAQGNSSMTPPEWRQPPPDYESILREAMDTLTSVSGGYGPPVPVDEEVTGASPVGSVYVAPDQGRVRAAPSSAPPPGRPQLPEWVSRDQVVSRALMELPPAAQRKLMPLIEEAKRRNMSSVEIAQKIQQAARRFGG